MNSWAVVLVKTQNGDRVGMTQEEVEFNVERHTEKEAAKLVTLTSERLNIPEFDNNVDESFEFLEIVP